MDNRIIQIYKKWEIEEQNLKLHIGKINNDDFVGANVTVPYKEKIVPFLDEIKDEAKFIRFEFMGRNYAGINSRPIMPPKDLKNVVSFHEQKNLDELDTKIRNIVDPAIDFAINSKLICNYS